MTKIKVFSREKFFNCKENKDLMSESWAEKCHGISKQGIEAMGYKVKDEWMDEVEVDYPCDMVFSRDIYTLSQKYECLESKLDKVKSLVCNVNEVID